MLDLKAYSETRYQLFLKKIAENKKVYIISDGETAAMFPSNEYVFEKEEYVQMENTVDEGERAHIVPFWSDQALPSEWLNSVADDDLSVVELSLEQFFNILCHYEEMGAPVGLEWNHQGVGIEIMASAVLDEVEKLLNNSELS